MSRDRSGPRCDLYRWIVNLIGPLLRSLARERVQMAIRAETADDDVAAPDHERQDQFASASGERGDAGRFRDDARCHSRRAGSPRRSRSRRPTDSSHTISKRRSADDSRAAKRAAQERGAHRAAVADAADPRRALIVAGAVCHRADGGRLSLGAAIVARSRLPLRSADRAIGDRAALAPRSRRSSANAAQAVG